MPHCLSSGICFDSGIKVASELGLHIKRMVKKIACSTSLLESFPAGEMLQAKLSKKGFIPHLRIRRHTHRTRPAQTSVHRQPQWPTAVIGQEARMGDRQAMGSECTIPETSCSRLDSTTGWYHGSPQYLGWDIASLLRESA